MPSIPDSGAVGLPAAPVGEAGDRDELQCHQRIQQIEDLPALGDRLACDSVCSAGMGKCGLRIRARSVVAI
ncbi:hypothetical protein [Nocardia pneumoniae]|uniref:hypothetical protein n=1 Tax=Nocardia pneumoniae TaxID=228601 RepID=UPI0005949A04|nr:hypothetical protein [Nocardia pneumoniae]